MLKNRDILILIQYFAMNAVIKLKFTTANISALTVESL